MNASFAGAFPRATEEFVNTQKVNDFAELNGLRRIKPGESSRVREGIQELRRRSKSVCGGDRNSYKKNKSSVYDEDLNWESIVGKPDKDVDLAKENHRLRELLKAKDRVINMLTTKVPYNRTSTASDTPFDKLCPRQQNRRIKDSGLMEKLTEYAKQVNPNPELGYLISTIYCLKLIQKTSEAQKHFVHKTIALLIRLFLFLQLL